jgi:hypothetical protein
MKINILFSKSSKNIYISFCKNLFDTYLKPKTHIEKQMSKPTFTIWNMKINAHYCKHILFSIIEIKISMFHNYIMVIVVILNLFILVLTM